VTLSQSSEADRQNIFRQVAEKWIETGIEQYNKGFFEQAEQSLLRAGNYLEYLTDAKRKQLQELLGKVRAAAEERKTLRQLYRTVNELIKQDRLDKAKSHLEKIKDNKALTADERAQIEEALSEIDKIIKAMAILGEAEEVKPVVKKQPEPPPKKEVIKPAVEPDERKKKIAELYYRSMGYYRTGELAKAREGLIKVKESGLIPPLMVKTIESHLKQIDKKLAQKAKPQAAKPNAPKAKIPRPIVTEPNIPKPKVTMPGKVKEKITALKATEPVTEKGGYIEVIKRKTNTLRSYTNAVVNDAVAKAQKYISQGEFDKARAAVDTAKITVSKNQMYLGSELYKRYNDTLQQLIEAIKKAEKEQQKQLEEKQRQEAIKAQQQFREQMELERQERIKTLLENAKAYQKQQNYEAAVGALKNLLALDPQNDEALTLKDTLEDTIYFRDQVKVQKEINKQKADILLETERAGIPYAEEMVYPKDWKEIIASPFRQPKGAIGLNPLDEEIYKKLDQIVDLPQLTPTMPFSNAIEEFKKLPEDAPLGDKINVDWPDLLANADVDQTTPINMDPLSGVSLGTALQRLLDTVSGGFAQIGYVVDNGVIVIATVDSLPSKLVHRVYDVTDLLGQPAAYQQMPFMGMGMGMGYGGYGGGYGGYGGYGGGYGGYGGGYGGYGGGYGGYGGGYGGYGGGYGGYGGYGGGYGGYGGYGGGYGGYGGGYGGYGGYGGGYGGYGGYGGGYGGYGMGGYGMGGYGMGGYGGYGGYGMGGYGGDWRRSMRATELAFLIQQTVGTPEDWAPDDISGFTWGVGEGTITLYPREQPKKLAILQTVELHRQIEDLLNAMREDLGEQVSIEARFLVVSENFLEDIGLDIPAFRYRLGGKWGELYADQRSAVITAPVEATKVPGSLGGITPVLQATLGYGSILDDLEVAFLLRMTQAHADAKALTAPKVTVLNGESATFWVQSDVSYALPPDVYFGVYPGAYPGSEGRISAIQQRVDRIPTGTTLNITPTITPDKKYVLLNIITQMNDFLRMKRHFVEGPTGPQGEVQSYTVTLPETETSQVMTRVNVPDGGTLLLGGQKITAEIEKEAGVPVLSKVPIVGRLFGNRSVMRDQKILLILVKPTILLQEEREEKAIAIMESGL